MNVFVEYYVRDNKVEKIAVEKVGSAWFDSMEDAKFFMDQKKGQYDYIEFYELPEDVDLFPVLTKVVVESFKKSEKRSLFDWIINWGKLKNA